jgi:lipoprotein NlpI
MRGSRSELTSESTGRRSDSGRRVWALLALAALVLTASPGCASYRGAQLYSSGTQALDAGDTERAIHDLEAAARLVPQASQIYNHLGIAYSDAGRRDAALRAFDRALELDCDNAEAERNRAALAVPATGPMPVAESSVAD